MICCGFGFRGILLLLWFLVLAYFSVPVARERASSTAGIRDTRLSATTSFCRGSSTIATSTIVPSTMVSSTIVPSTIVLSNSSYLSALNSYPQTGLYMYLQPLYLQPLHHCTIENSFTATSPIASSTIATSTVAPEELPKTISGVLSVFFNHSFVRYLAHGIVCV